MLASPAIRGIDVDSLLIKSFGGEPAIAKFKSLKSFRADGRIIWNGVEGKYFAVYMAPNMYRVSADFGGFIIEQGINGSTPWEKNLHGGSYEQFGIEGKNFLQSMKLDLFRYVPGIEPGNQCEYVQQLTIDSMEYHEVNYFPFADDTISLFFIEETGRLDGYILFRDHYFEDCELEDYQQVDGMWFAFNSRHFSPYSSTPTTVQLDSINFDLPISQDFFARPISEFNDFRFSAKSESITIPIRFQNGWATISVEVNGIKKGWFILDTGASASNYHTEFAKDFKFEPVTELPVAALGGQENMQLVHVDSLKFDNLTMYNQTAGVLPLDKLADRVQKKITFGGVLGNDFFMRFPVLIDFRKEELTIFDPKNFKLPDSGECIPFHFTMMVPAIEVGINGVKGNFIIDLGNTLGLIVYPNFFEKLTSQSAIDTSNSVNLRLAGIGADISGRIIEIKSLQIRAHKLNVPEAILVESTEGLSGSREIAGIIGTKVLEQYSILFDYPNSRIVLYNLPESDE